MAKWHEGSKVIWGLFSLVLTVGILAAGALWGVAQENSHVNATQSTEIKAIQTTIEIEIRHTKEGLVRIETEQQHQRVMLENVLRGR